MLRELSSVKQGMVLPVPLSFKIVSHESLDLIGYLIPFRMASYSSKPFRSQVAHVKSAVPMCSHRRKPWVLLLPFMLKSALPGSDLLSDSVHTHQLFPAFQHPHRWRSSNQRWSPKLALNLPFLSILVLIGVETSQGLEPQVTWRSWEILGVSWAW